MSETIRITVVGLGSIGTSIALALKKADPDTEITGHDREQSVARRARKEGAVDQADWNLISACEEADVTILAIPFGEVKDTLVAAGPYFRAGCLVMDTCSAKSPVLRWADENLGEGVNFVGGSPILRGGKRSPDADLFVGSLFCLCPSTSASPESVGWASGLVRSIGARPFFIDAVEHDGVMAGVDHVPILVAAALLRASRGSAAWREGVRLGGSRFTGATASIVGDAVGHAGLVLANPESVVRWLDAFQAELSELRGLIVNHEHDELGEALKVAQDAREEWARSEVGAEDEGPTFERGFRSLLMGDRGGKG